VKENIYNNPEYYDIAFSWDNTKEMEMFKRFFQKHVEFTVKNVLEPACGTGRFLIAFPEHGYRITGYDNNPKMVAYAKEKIRTAGYDNMADVFLMDMKSAKMDKKYDSAFNSINSLGYLLGDEDILSHFQNTGKSIKHGGIYIVHLACAWDKLESHENEGWTMNREGISVRTVWDIEKEDKQKKLSYQVCKMFITDHGEKIEIVDHHTLRLWFFTDLKKLINDSQMFQLEAIYNEKQERKPLDTHIIGELGNLYYILKVI
jgi:SAM-dependent methyltransferase